MYGRARGFFCLVLLCACVLGARGERPFSNDWGLADIDTVRIAVPDTPLTVQACDPAAQDCARLEISGRWLSVGGTRQDAKDNTENGRLDFQSEGGFALVTAVKSLDVQDLLDLEIESIRLPWDRALELATGVGHVTVDGVDADLSVETEVGDVDVDAGVGNVLVRTDQGVVRVQSGGVADLRSGSGGVELLQDGAARDAFIHTGYGNVVVEIAADANLELFIRAPGRIDVKTNLINTITSGDFWRETGNGTTRIEVISQWGNVAVRMYDPD